MSKSEVWAVDQIAAASLVRSLGIAFDGGQTELLAKHMAEHRRSSFELVLSRVRSKLVERIERLITDHGHYRGPDWTAACMSAEEAVHTITSSQLRELVPNEPLTAGQRLRSLMHHARKEREGEFRVIT